MNGMNGCTGQLRRTRDSEASVYVDSHTMSECMEIGNEVARDQRK